MVRMSASKARVVLNLIRGKQVAEAMEILNFSERLASEVISKCLASAVANAEHNEDLQAGDLFVSACFADEGPTLKRFRPRARGRAGRIHKQTCHITVEVARLTDEELDQLRVSAELKNEGRASRSKTKSDGGGDRAARVAKSKAATDEPAEEPTDEVEEAEEVEEAIEAEATEAEADVVDTDEGSAEEADSESEVADATSSDEAPSADGADGDTDDDTGVK
jgi:large subunit ribosomal protein L22